MSIKGLKAKLNANGAVAGATPGTSSNTPMDPAQQARIQQRIDYLKGQRQSQRQAPTGYSGGARPGPMGPPPTDLRQMPNPAGQAGAVGAAAANSLGMPPQQMIPGGNHPMPYRGGMPVGLGQTGRSQNDVSEEQIQNILNMIRAGGSYKPGGQPMMSMGGGVHTQPGMLPQQAAEASVQALPQQMTPMQRGGGQNIGQTIGNGMNMLIPRVRK